jgi:hypothetical protein
MARCAELDSWRTSKKQDIGVGRIIRSRDPRVSWPGRYDVAPEQLGPQDTQQRYLPKWARIPVSRLVSDVGAVFGNSNFWRRTKADLKAYQKGKFLREVSAEEIDLRLPTRPPCRFLLAFPFYIQRTRLAHLAEDMPRHHVEWIGQLLAQLSTQQISDAFRAGGFEPSEVEGFTQEVQRRISELRRLI